MTGKPISYLKAHGTGNDFVVISALTESIDFTAQQVAQICDRHFGIGADGLLRVAKAVDFGVSDAQYFMDYRNADGSIAETCGNGLRVFARYLLENQLVSPGTFAIGTRAGTVQAYVDPNDAQFRNIGIQMGMPGGSLVYEVPKVTTEISSWPATAVFMPNPHAVVVVDDTSLIGSLADQPHLAPRDVFPNGANVEFIQRIADNHIRMRTFERGVGETLSCGSGACAAASVWATRNSLPAGWTVQVDVLGGTVFVDSDPDGSLTLRGPADFVATGALIGDQWLI